MRIYTLIIDITMMEYEQNREGNKYKPDEQRSSMKPSIRSLKSIWNKVGSEMMK